MRWDIVGYAAGFVLALASGAETYRRNYSLALLLAGLALIAASHNNTHLGVVGAVTAFCGFGWQLYNLWKKENGK